MVALSISNKCIVYFQNSKRLPIITSANPDKDRKKNQVLSETIIRNATEQWITQPIHLRNPLRFLQMASHFITPQFLNSVFRSSGGQEEDIPETSLQEDQLVVQPLAVSLDPIPMNNMTGPVPGIQHNSYNQPPPYTVREPPPLAFIPQVLEQGRKRVEEMKRRKKLPNEPPPLMPILRNK